MSLFPSEIWLCIIERLHASDLLHLSLSCCRLHELCLEKLDEAKRLYTKYRSIDIGHMRQEHKHPFHVLLLRFLRTESLCLYIIELDCSETCKRVSDEMDTVRTAPQLDANDRKLLKQSVDTSPWIPDGEKDFYFQGICQGDEDTVLSVLIPLLTNLRWMCPPINAELLSKTMGRIAAATVTSSITPIGNSPTTLRKLVAISTRAFNGNDFGIELECLANFAALPSVKRIRAHCVRDNEFPGWPNGVPQSRVPLLYFSESSISTAAIQGFAHGFNTLCTMRQEFSYTGESCVDDAVSEWDHCEILGTVDPATGGLKEDTRYEIIEKRYSIDSGDFLSEALDETMRPSSQYSVEMNRFWDGTLETWKQLIEI